MASPVCNVDTSTARECVVVAAFAVDDPFGRD
jgi:hypothetical protein